MTTSELPRERGFDHTLALWREGYRYIGRRCDAFGADAFRTRLMLRPVVCMRGAAAAEVFYRPGRFTRAGSMPITTLKLLQDFGSVQLLEGEAHRHRKAMFRELASDQAADELAAVVSRLWTDRLARWEAAPSINLYDEVRDILTRGVCAWSGIGLDETAARRRTRELSEMVASAGSIGPRNWRALFLRRRSERWARRLLGGIRDGTIAAPEGSVVRRIAMHRDGTSEFLGLETASVELLNVLRPTVAVTWYIVSCALALHQNPRSCELIGAGDDEHLRWFIQEVRRTAPFFPFIGGRVREPFDWRGHRFEEGDWVLLDLYGTNHDQANWAEPDAFCPERFAARTPTPFDLIPQGAGDPAVTHRCPGEAFTLRLMEGAVRLLTQQITYEVPPQDLSVDLSRMPALPKSGFVIANVRRAS